VRSAKISVAPGYGDIMTALQMSLRSFHLDEARIFSIAGAVGFFCAIGSALLIARKRFSQRMELALIAPLTLACFTHVVYDFVFMLFPIAALLELRQKTATDRTDEPRHTKGIVALGWAAILYLLLFGTIKKHFHPAEWLPFV